MPDVNTYLFSQGVLGVVVIALTTVIIKLYNKTEKQQLRIEELQELRLQDTKEVAKDITTVLEGNSQSNRILAEKIVIAKEQGLR